MKTMIRKIAGAALDLIYPSELYCICCGKIIDSTRTYRLCDDCMDNMRWIGSRTCIRCGKRLGDNNPMEICYGCRGSAHYFARGYTCTEYGACERAIIFSLKYNGRSDIGDTLGEIMYDRMNSEYSDNEMRAMFDLVLPVPVHRRKRAERGYNQAALIAEGFASRAGIRCDDRIIIRQKNTRMMRSLKPDERKANIEGAFGIERRRLRDLSGRSVLIIDDIYTTGATVDEVARILKKGRTDAGGNVLPGASEVSILTFAAGADMIKNS